jgi:DNA-binding GntR family transcriptional regulator
MKDEVFQGTLAERIFEQIFDLILTGELPLGGIVNEAILAERFSVSRGPVREAIRRLQGVRLVTREPYMKARVVQFSKRDLADIFELREAAEGMACRLATEKMLDVEIQELMDQVERSPQNNPGQRKEMDIHMRIARGCGNKRIETLLSEDIYHLMRIYRYQSGSEPGRWDRACEEHWQIAKAMQAREPRLAESLMRSHISAAIQTAMKSLEKIEMSVTGSVVNENYSTDNFKTDAAPKVSR